ncbi:MULTISPECIES: PTS IIA-like nitrogen regulatory protein PtsN [Deefgea]|uniref:PTS IIA-like nitrogen regulatory protein PtsN n=2 Tax=Deefgea TaxID=400947 RepID=A0A6M8SS79_9NEIS|nr:MULTISPECIES: PTS IIA-like nitrogen regulatory protein PtsN [Deefgea]MBM5573507.1 PTS IIA-like nitrogen regulatory protein PtsN [Deefgea sp. CFH1-16]MCB5196081.1 PTS IIA-like nitrogen regulatory protein PtsN [Deefgea salmonis]QKJ68055.1 PTS IIA-like nitrogen regulatory protein PtsN [Deefgea piscis]QZA82773.1 PTS IIA-like nitrogen regulatory protein PtsN [Deefgea piscis]
MSLISKILPVANVFLDLDVGSKKRVFEHVGILFENSHGIARSVIFDSLFAREKLGSTGLGQGVAIPHGRIKGLKEAVGAFVRLSAPIQFDAPDSKPVSLIFVLLVPANATDLHLQILSELAQLFSDKQLREELMTLPDPEAVWQRISTWEPYAPDFS